MSISSQGPVVNQPARSAGQSGEQARIAGEDRAVFAEFRLPQVLDIDGAQITGEHRVVFSQGARAHARINHDETTVASDASPKERLRRAMAELAEWSAMYMIEGGAVIIRAKTR